MKLINGLIVDLGVTKTGTLKNLKKVTINSKKNLTFAKNLALWELC